MLHAPEGGEGDAPVSPELQAALGPIVAALATGIPLALAAVKELRAVGERLVGAIERNTDAVTLQADETRHLRLTLDRWATVRSPEPADRQTWPPSWAGPTVSEHPPSIRAATQRSPR